MTRRLPVLCAIVLCILAATTTTAFVQSSPSSNHEVDGRRSGYLFLSDSTRGLQDDEFQNPGMFALEKGHNLWNRKEGVSGTSCATCHGPAEVSMRGVAARYPVFDTKLRRLINLELRINDERTRRMKVGAFPYESEDLIAIATYVTRQSRGQPMAVVIDGPARPMFERGREFFMKRRGQLNLACNQCHENAVGSRLRGDVISQGQVNGFPSYRLTWRSMSSRHRMFSWCNTSIRAEPYPLGSEEYLNLELYLAWRGRGLPVEAPSVRR